MSPQFLGDWSTSRPIIWLTILLGVLAIGVVCTAAADRVLNLLVDLQTVTETALVVVSHDRALGEAFDRTVRLVDGRLSPAHDR